MMKLVFATNNQHKLNELRQIAGPEIEILGLTDIGCTQDIPETGSTLEENALQKARFVYDNFGLDCFADDTGLEVEALDGAPGVYSARYAKMFGGADHDSKANMKALLANLAGTENRRARFRTSIALILNGDEHAFEGIVNGEIIDSPAGDEGFGYDPIFRPEGWDITFAQADSAQKNAKSHRGRAVAKLLSFLNKIQK